MIKEFVDAWDKYKGNLEKYFRKNKMSKYDEYKGIVKLLFVKVINPYIEKDLCDEFLNSYNYKKIKTIDYGDYQGDKIFIIPQETYQPTIEECIYTHTHYGSCSGCDTLKRIIDYKSNELPNDEQVKDFMALSLHLLQKMHKMYDTNTDDSEYNCWEEIEK